MIILVTIPKIREKEKNNMNLIVAVDENFAIGNKQGLLCHLPEDLKHFKELTTGRTVLMGYNTLMSLPGSAPLKNRRNIVLTSKSITVEGAEVVHSVAEALERCDEDTFIIGGESIYRQFLPFCRKAYVTHIKKAFEADTFFPVLGKEWRLIEESAEKQYKEISFTFATYKNTDLKGQMQALYRVLSPQEERRGVRIMSHNVLHQSYHQLLTTDERLQTAAGCYLHFLPDSLGLQEFHRDLRPRLEELLEGRYLFVQPPYPQGEKDYTPLLYRPDRLKPVETRFHSFFGKNKGLWSYDCAVYEDLREGGEVIHVNLHFHYDEKEIPPQARLVNGLIRELKTKYPDAVVAITGDHNADRDSEAFSLLFFDTDLESACELCTDPAQRGNTWHTPDRFEFRAEKEIDHVSFSQDTATLSSYRRVADPFISLASDHFPVLADLKRK